MLNAIKLNDGWSKIIKLFGNKDIKPSDYPHISKFEPEEYDKLEEFKPEKYEENIGERSKLKRLD